MEYTQSQEYKDGMKARRKQERERKALLTPEQRQQEKYENESRKEWNRIQARENKEAIAARKLVTRERKILNFMKKTKVEYHHHSKVDIIDIKPHLETLKKTESHTEYDSYYWNHSGGSSQMPIALLGRLWSGPFDSMYDVPLDGSFIFQCYDSGMRGLGSFGRITAIKVEDEAYVPHVNPGAIIPITAN